MIIWVAAVLGVIAVYLGLRADVRRRKLLLTRSAGWTLLIALDVASVSLSIGCATALVVVSPHIHSRPDSLFSPATLGAVACAAALLFLWPEGQRQVQLQRPAGVVFAEWGILFGTYQLMAAFVFHQSLIWPSLSRFAAVGIGLVLPITAGSLLLRVIVPPFVKGHEEHRILDRIASQGEFVQSEWAGPTPECPFPERWQMLDAQSAEVDVLEFLKTLVITVKPDLVVETGTFIGHSAMKMAEGLKRNGFGRIITVEYDPLVFAKAKQQIDASGLSGWIEYRNASSLDTKIDGPIDILFSDSDPKIREQEVRRFLPQIKPRGLVLIHDASSHFTVVREAALRLEQEGLLSVVLLSTPRGLVLAQKRQGRT